MADERVSLSTRSPRYTSRRALGFTGGSPGAGGNIQQPTFLEVAGVQDDAEPSTGEQPPIVDIPDGEPAPETPSAGEQALAAGATQVAGDALKEGAKSVLGSFTASAGYPMPAPVPVGVSPLAPLPGAYPMPAPVPVGVSPLAPAPTGGAAAIEGGAAVEGGAAAGAGGLSGSLAAGGLTTIGALALPAIAGFSSGRSKKAKIQAQNDAVERVLGTKDFYRLMTDRRTYGQNASNMVGAYNRANNPAPADGDGEGNNELNYVRVMRQDPNSPDAIYNDILKGKTRSYSERTLAPTQQHIQGAAAGKPGYCFITEAVTAAGGQGDNAEELQVLRWFRDNVLMTTPQGQSLVNEYYQIAPMVVDAVAMRPDALQIFQAIKSQYLDQAVEAVKSGNFKAALEIYAQMISFVEPFAAEMIAGEHMGGPLEQFGQHGAIAGMDDETSAMAAPGGAGDADFAPMGQHAEMTAADPAAGAASGAPVMLPQGGNNPLSQFKVPMPDSTGRRYY